MNAVPNRRQGGEQSDFERVPQKYLDPADLEKENYTPVAQFVCRFENSECGRERPKKCG